MIPFLQPRRRKRADDSVLPWYHPWVVMREIWNVAFSAVLGLAIGALVYDMLAMLLAALSGGAKADWHGRTLPFGVAAGLFAAIVTFLSYRMDDNSGS